MNKKYQGTNAENGINISMTEIKSIYQTLSEQYESLSIEIIESVECNDYVRLSLLLNKRRELQTALKEIVSLHGDELSQPTIKHRFSNVLKTSAETTKTRGDDVLNKFTNGIETVNHSAHNLATKTLRFSNKTISKGARLNHSVGKVLVKNTAKGLSKLADMFNKQ